MPVGRPPRQLRTLTPLLALLPALALAMGPERGPRAGEAPSGQQRAADLTPPGTPASRARPAARPRSSEGSALERNRRDPPAETVSAAQAAEHYRQGQRMEQDGRQREAMSAYLTAARSGHGPAQKRLGILYGRGSTEVPRDYAESVQWYERARRSGEDVPEPLQFSAPRAGH